MRQRHGADAIAYYGSDESEAHGACFTISSIPATISVHTQDGTLQNDLYDVQIEGIPQGDYVYCSVVDLQKLLSLIEQLRQPISKWPMSAA